MHGSLGQNTLNRHMLTNDDRPMHAMLHVYKTNVYLQLHFFNIEITHKFLLIEYTITKKSVSMPFLFSYEHTFVNFMFE